MTNISYNETMTENHKLKKMLISKFIYVVLEVGGQINDVNFNGLSCILSNLKR